MHEHHLHVLRGLAIYFSVVGWIVLWTAILVWVADHVTAGGTR